MFTTRRPRFAKLMICYDLFFSLISYFYVSLYYFVMQQSKNPRCSIYLTGKSCDLDSWKQTPNCRNISTIHATNSLASSKLFAPPRKSSRKAVANVPIKSYACCFINMVSLVIIYGDRIAFNNYLANFVNTPGAGAQPKGSPTH